MLETVKFPVGDCPDCGPNRLLAWDLDGLDELVAVCSHCDTPIPDDLRKRDIGALGLKHYGYLVEGEGKPQKGCGTSGGSCSSGSCGTCGTGC